MSISIDGVVIREVTLAKDRTTLGRRAYNDIVVDNLAVSGEHACLLYTSPSPRDLSTSRMPSSA